MAKDSKAGAVLTIDLASIVANWRLLCARHKAGAVVKADAYGLGAIPVVEALRDAGCRQFFVATAEEAFAVRETIPDADLIVLGGAMPGIEPDLAAGGIIPALGLLAEIASWSALASRLERALPAAIHFDTGMSRLGLSAPELDILAAGPARLQGIDVRWIMSHLVSAEIASAQVNVTQRDRFNSGRKRLPPAPASLVNSAGIFLDDSFRFDLARPGSALFGINPTPERRNPMRPVVTLLAPVLAVRDIPAGATVGYGATWTAARASRIATIGVGYADGWHRAHSNLGRAFFDGTPVPLVGRVSMDLTTFDVTDVPAIQPGAWLELLGPHQTVDDAARSAGTIGYEILTALGRRYRRVYREA